jgi:hypothetical protein
LNAGPTRISITLDHVTGMVSQFGLPVVADQNTPSMSNTVCRASPPDVHAAVFPNPPLALN